MYQSRQLLLLSLGKILGSRPPLEDFPADGHGDGATGFIEEGDGYEETEGVVAEAFLDETERGGGEGWERDA